MNALCNTGFNNAELEDQNWFYNKKNSKIGFYQKNPNNGFQEIDISIFKVQISIFIYPNK